MAKKIAESPDKIGIKQKIAEMSKITGHWSYLYIVSSSTDKKSFVETLLNVVNIFFE